MKRLRVLRSVRAAVGTLRSRTVYHGFGSYVSLVMVLVLVIGSVPLPAFAEERQDSPATSSNTDSVETAAVDTSNATALAEEPYKSPEPVASATLDAAEGTANAASATVNPTTGAAQTSVRFQLPRARGQAQPSLGISYSSMAGASTEVGYAWNLDVAKIERVNRGGGPTYQDGNPGDPKSDRLRINGTDLVPICRVSARQCVGTTLPVGEQLPADLDDWWYFRTIVDNGVRYFWSPDRKTFRADSKSGVQTEFGAPRDKLDDVGGIDFDEARAGDPKPPFRWKLVRQWGDGKANVVVYRWQKLPLETSSGQSYLTDIYDSPAIGSDVRNPGNIPHDAFAHHVRLTYSIQFSEVFANAAPWRARPNFRLDRVDITSADFNGSSPRHLVKRYALEYWEPREHAQQVRSLLKRVHLTGACPDLVEDGESGIPATHQCITQERDLAQMTYTGYGDVNRSPSDQTSQFEHTADPQKSELKFFDFNTDGSPDVISMATDANSPTQLPLGMAAGGSYRPGIIDLRNGQINPNLRSVLSSPGTSWNQDGKVNFFRGDGARLETYSPSPQGIISNNWSLASNGIIDVSGTVWGQLRSHPQIVPKLLDFDGDGNLDVIEYFLTGEPARFEECRFATARDETGRILPYSHGPYKENGPATKEGCIPSDTTSGHYNTPRGQSYYQDFSGDGIPDLIYMQWDQRNDGSKLFDQKWTVRYGNGYGDFSAAVPIANGLTGLISQDFVADTYLHDINGDNIADRVDVRNTTYSNGAGEPITDPNPGIDIYLGNGRAWTGPPIHFSPNPSQPPYVRNWAWLEHVPMGGGVGSWRQPLKVQFVDPHGSGNAGSIIVTAAKQDLYKLVVRYDIVSGRPAMLSTITNGLGATTKLDYERTQANIPGSHFHVSKVTVSSNADVRETGGPYVTTYYYQDAVYDYLEHQFRGFRHVHVTTGDEGTPKRVSTDTRYLFPGCQDGAGLEVPCAPAVDNPRWAIRALPATVERYDATTGVYLSKTHHQYQMDKLYSSPDGRNVRRIYPEATDTWRFDTAPGYADETEIDITDLESEEQFTLQNKERIPARTNSAHTRTTQQLDRFGNVNYRADYGVVESFDPSIPKDSSIVEFNNWTLAGDSTRWLWRPRETLVRVSQGTPDLKHSYFEYNQRGQLIKTFSDLRGTLPLQRFHENGADVAPVPADASQNGDRLLASETIYDDFGNPKRIKNATGSRCADTTYDERFGQLAIAQTAYAGGCGVGGLTTTLKYDRGLEVVTATTAPTGAVTTTTYDGWGRPTAVYRPDPELGVLPVTEPSVRTTYFDVQDGPYQRVQVETRVDDGYHEGDAARYHSAWSYTDPYGHAVGAWKQADPANGDEEPYIANGRVERDSRGLVVRAYEPYFTSEAPLSSSPPAIPAGVASSTAIHDAFGRTTDTFGLEGEPVGRVAFHALSEDTFDAADLAQGAIPHPLRTIRDGHGRHTVTTKTTTQSGSSDTISTRMEYTPTGALKAITRQHSAGSDVYRREMTYDSWGRLVQTAEPNTSTGFGTTSLKTWRYAYNDSGDVVGTSDARGCGKNVQWDGFGRPVSETYSPCLRTQRPYDGNVTSLFLYDAPEQGHTGANAAFFAGKLAASYDRAQHSRYTYDGRGRTKIVERQLAVPDPDDLAFGGGGGVSAAPGSAAADGGAPPTPGGEYAPHWYRTKFAYDEADRERARAVGARSTEVPELYGNPVTLGWLNSNDTIVTTYTARGIAKTIGTSYGNLIMAQKVEADGFVRSITYGDKPREVIATFDPDGRRRLLHTGVTGEGPAPKIMQDWSFEYDVADNPTKVTDGRNEADWPDGAKPVSKQMAYDDLNQLRRVDYSYKTQSTDDKQVSPFAPETKSGDRRPIPEGPQAKRAKWQSYDFDWQGNLTKSDDDAHAFHDRSAGTMSYGTPTNGPNRVASAEGTSGHAQTTYDAAGNLTKLVLTKQGPTGAALNFTFSYEWDEVGQMVRAKRDPIPGGDPGADFHYTYDAGGQRITKSVEDPHTFDRTYSCEIFPTLRLDHARFQNGDYERTKDTVTLYLIANGTAMARVIYDPELPQAPGRGPQHTFFTLTDPMGSTSAVFEKYTGELVERATYLAYGQTESDYRPERWKAYREHFRFTGKEDDVGVGLTYFGARYYVPALGQWASADPLTIHGAGSDLNPYAYVFGSPQKLTDPSGLATSDQELNVPLPGQRYSTGGAPDPKCGRNEGVEDGGCEGAEVLVPRPPIEEKKQEQRDLATDWVKFVLWTAHDASQGRPGNIGKGVWNAVVDTARDSILASPTWANDPGGIVAAGVETISLSPPTTPAGQRDYRIGYTAAVVVPMLLGVAAIAKFGAQAAIRGGAVLVSQGGLKGIAARASGAVSRLADDALVCRGGTCTAERWAGGSGVTLDSAGRLQGASVNSAPGATLEQLTATIPNKQVGVTTVGQVRALGGDVVPSPTYNNPVHCTLCGITPQQAQQLFTPTVLNPSL